MLQLVNNFPVLFGTGIFTIARLWIDTFYCFSKVSFITLSFHIPRKRLSPKSQVFRIKFCMHVYNLSPVCKLTYHMSPYSVA